MEVAALRFVSDGMISETFIMILDPALKDVPWTDVILIKITNPETAGGQRVGSRIETGEKIV
jgi:hypothetical protein